MELYYLLAKISGCAIGFFIYKSYKKYYKNE